MTTRDERQTPKEIRTLLAKGIAGQRRGQKQGHHPDGEMFMYDTPHPP
jgi:hypothetical protein